MRDNQTPSPQVIRRSAQSLAVGSASYQGKQAYSVPVLTAYGDIRSITLGSTAGVIDSPPDAPGGPLQT